MPTGSTHNSLSIKFPFALATGSGVFAMNYKTIDMYKSNLYSLLMTKRGERAMQPDLGSPIYDYFFENIDNDTMKFLESDIKGLVEIWLPELTIHNIVMNQDESSHNSFYLIVSFSLNETPEDIEEIKLEVG
jgi:phage baseplate assembly protein W